MNADTNCEATPKSEKAIRRMLRKQLGSRTSRKTGTKERVMRNGQRNTKLRRPRAKAVLNKKYAEYLEQLCRTQSQQQSSLSQP